jgi:ABC-type glycerol-3-phosphate transport system substrate-binding protein
MILKLAGGEQMKEFVKFLLLMVGILVTALLFATACHDATDETLSDTPIDGLGDTSNDAPLTGTLSISQCYDFYYLEAAIEKFKKIHPDVVIVLNKYYNDREKYQQLITTQLLAGEADDLLDATAFSDIELAASGLLADFYPLMKNDPTFNEDDYYMNVFEAMAHKNKLIVFPACFTYLMIGVNNVFSPDLADKFRQYDKISLRELLDLYNSVEDKGHRYISQNIDALSATYDNINAFVDLENKTCSFNTPEYIRFITDIKNGTAPQKIANGEIGFTYGFTYFSKANQEEYALSYLFANTESNVYQIFLPNTEDEILTHFIPLVSENGKLNLVPIKRFCINEASKNKELAWEFVKFITTPEANEGVFIPTFPVNKELFQTYAVAELTQYIDYWRREFISVEGETADVVEQVKDILEAYNEMPMEYQPYFDFEAIPEIIKSYYAGTLTAEQAALELQNKVSLYLKE